MWRLGLPGVRKLLYNAETKHLFVYMHTQEIFTPEERDENNERKRKLFELVASGQAILIVGAGSSARVGYPNWPRLLNKLKDFANKSGGGFKVDEEMHEDDPKKYLEDAEKIKSHICKQKNGLEKYYAMLQNLFCAKNPPCKEFHRKLVSLPFKGILTTNYDPVLEAALNAIEPHSAYDNSLVIDGGSPGRVHEFLRSMTETNLTRRIAHLHGKFDSASSIILSIDDYKRAYGLDLTVDQVQKDSDWTLHRKLLWAVLATRRVVFIGFSMTDPYLNQMLETVSTDLWAWGRSTHYVIMSIGHSKCQNVDDSKTEAERLKIKAIKLKEKYGVDTVFYENTDGLHLRLDHIVGEIAERYGVGIQPTIVSQERPDSKDSRTDEIPASVESKSGDELDWLEQMNQRMERRMGDEN